VQACHAAHARGAWAAGFALALGDRTRHFWLEHLDEHTAGNMAGWDLRHAHDDPQPGPRRPFLVQPVVGALAVATSST